MKTKLLKGAMTGIAFFVGGFVNIANAGFIHNSTGLTSPVTTVTFSEVALANDTVVTDQFLGLGMEFGALSPTDGLYFSSTAGSQGAGLQNFFPDTYNPFVIYFTTAVSEAAFEMITNGTTDTFTAFLNGNVVETASLRTGLWRFYGFTGIVFDEIRVGIGGDVGSGNQRHMRLDNVQIGSAVSVSEPPILTILALGLMGLAGLSFARYRRQS